MARQIEARYPQVDVTEVLFEPDEPGLAMGFGVEPRVNPDTNRLYKPGFNAVYIDPATGEETGKRDWGAVCPIGKDNFVAFLYVLHYSLHLPEMWGTDRWGTWAARKHSAALDGGLLHRLRIDVAGASTNQAACFGAIG